jgi:hypothetical protein
MVIHDSLIDRVGGTPLVRPRPGAGSPTSTRTPYCCATAGSPGLLTRTDLAARAGVA